MSGCHVSALSALPAVDRRTDCRNDRQHDTAIKLAGVTVAGLFFFFFSRSRIVFRKKTRGLQEEVTVQAQQLVTRDVAEGATTVIGEGG